MLPSNILPVIAKEGKVRPRYMFLNPQSLSLLSDMISLFKSARGSKRGELESMLEGFESGLDFKTIRCVKALLLRRCEFASNSPLDPIGVRRAVFHKASEVGVTSKEERDWVIQRCAKEMPSTTESVEGSLWADMEEEQVLSSFKDIEPQDLLRLFNLSIAQTLLFKARKMEVKVPEGSIGVVASAKRLGLMYRVERVGGLFKIEIEGPLSALKLCERYGNQMARLLPEIVAQPRWELSATIAWKGEKLSLFELASAHDGHLMRYLERGDEDGEGASEKERLVARIREALPGWEVDAAPSPITTGGATFLPDLKIAKGDVRVYLEMLGFWTEDFVRKRSAASFAGGANAYLTLADRGLTCSLKGAKGAGVILYDKRSLIKEIVSAVKAFETENRSKGAKEEAPEIAPGPENPITGDLLDLRALARKHGTDEESVYRSLEPKGYVRVRELLVSKRMAERIAADVMGAKSYLDASVLIRNAGIPYPDDLLRELGFTVVWHGLDPQNAVVRYVG
jgi:predicted nuclease of restriction endonuclease-like RecB superfamily